MGRQHHYRRRTKDPADLDMTTFLNLMVVLVPFLLITAVFSRITIVELSLPSSAGGAAAPNDPGFRVEVEPDFPAVSSGRSWARRRAARNTWFVTAMRETPVPSWTG